MALQSEFGIYILINRHQGNLKTYILRKKKTEITFFYNYKVNFNKTFSSTPPLPPRRKISNSLKGCIPSEILVHANPLLLAHFSKSSNPDQSLGGGRWVVKETKQVWHLPASLDLQQLYEMLFSCQLPLLCTFRARLASSRQQNNIMQCSRLKCVGRKKDNYGSIHVFSSLLALFSLIASIKQQIR